MKKVIIVFAIAAVAYYFIMGGSFNKGFDYDGATYSHVKKMGGGQVTNHFYTPAGTDLTTAKKFIQIIEVGDEIPMSDWPSTLTPMFSQYNLKPVSDEPLELSGSVKKADYYFVTYAASMKINDIDCMIFYVISHMDKPSLESRSEINGVITKLRRIEL